MFTLYKEENIILLCNIVFIFDIKTKKGDQVGVTLLQCSNWEKLSRGAQSNDLKTAFHERNYSTQTCVGGGGALPPTHRTHLPYINFKYHFSATHFEFQIGIIYFYSNIYILYCYSRKKNV